MTKEFKIFAGLSGAFGGASYQGLFKGTEEQAYQHAWELACEEFEQYEGLHGLPSYGEILEEFEEDGLDNAEDAAWEAFQEERELWLAYYCKEVGE